MTVYSAFVSYEFDCAWIWIWQKYLSRNGINMNVQIQTRSIISDHEEVIIVDIFSSDCESILDVLEYGRSVLCVWHKHTKANSSNAYGLSVYVNK